jgi:hypothetical protein
MNDIVHGNGGRFVPKERRQESAEVTARRLRRFRSVKKALISDLGGDPSKAQEVLAHNAAALAMVCEEKVDTLVAGRAVEIGELSTLMNTLRRQLETLGIERKPKDVTSLARYLEERRSSGVTINGTAQ